MRERIPLQAAVALAALFVLVWVVASTPTVLLAQPWSKATFHGPGELTALLLRLTFLLVALGSPLRLSALGMVAFVASLACRGALPILAGVSVVSAFAGSQGRFGLPLPVATLIAALLVGSIGLDRMGSPPELPDTLPDQVVYFQERGNPLRAKAAARRWCERETPPGLGCLVLAEAEDGAGNARRALALARQVSERASAPDVRARAQRWLEERKR